MSQNVTAKQMGVESAQDPIAVVATVETVTAETVAVESYADRLMDELFEGVDRAFDESGGLPTEPVQPEIITLKSISVPQIVLSPPPAMGYQRSEKDVAAIARRVALETTKKHQSKQSFDKMLLGAAFGSLMLVLGLWLASRSGLVRLPVATTTSTTPTATTKTAPDTEFSEYVQRSLEAIEQKKSPQANVQLPGVPGVAPPGTLPNISISGAPPATAGLSTAVNRVAEAIEQAAAQQPGAPTPQVVIIPPANTTVTNPLPAPTVAVSPSANPPSSGRAIAVAGSTSPSTSPVATSPSPSTSPEPKISAREEPAAPPAAAPAAAAPSAAAPSAAAVQPAAPQSQPATPSVSTTPTAAHTLVGILELGDRSAALFEVDGVARRIYVGESIGASGWTLAEIKNQEAVIRKGGDVRSVFVGQKF
ncbi:MAG: hypothetical protein P2A85_03560 [Microcoleus anatoxicus]|uniref:hypothetical protein n=1 Tax=Microcoleus anatoxicus TaxID=2705319 RepID=UPI00366BDCA5